MARANVLRTVPITMVCALGAACIAHTTPATRETTAALPVTVTAPVRAAQQSDTVPSVPVAHDTVRPGPTRNYTIDIDAPPEGFYQLAARERERWHVCHVLFLTPGDAASHDPPGNPQVSPSRSGDMRRMSGHSLPQPARLHLGFTAHVGDYVALPDERARREFLVRNGCPPSLVDLADGTHIDLVEGTTAPLPVSTGATTTPPVTVQPAEGPGLGMP